MKTDGMTPRQIVDTANRLMVEKRGLEAIRDYFAPDYVDHNPGTPGGNLEGLLQTLRDMGFTEEAPNDRVFELTVHHLIAENDLVLVHQQIAEAGNPTMMFMDLFRVRDGLIVEHWDVIQNVPDDPVNKAVPMA
ncbi:MAG: nuclear transport factor 2 family protein [Sphingomonadales bacterium]|nr:nuclear transport factor 2 family protein [Sphingomonadales bacterium]